MTDPVVKQLIRTNTYTSRIGHTAYDWLFFLPCVFLRLYSYVDSETVVFRPCRRYR